MPGVMRHTIDRLLAHAETSVELGSRPSRFSGIDKKLKTADGREVQTNRRGLVPRAVAALKKRFPELGVITMPPSTRTPRTATTGSSMQPGTS